jgi:hypothetical protein
MAVMGDSEGAVNGLNGGHDLKEVAQLFKCYELHVWGIFLIIGWILDPENHLTVQEMM